MGNLKFLVPMIAPYFSNLFHVNQWEWFFPRLKLVQSELTIDVKNDDPRQMSHPELERIANFPIDSYHRHHHSPPLLLLFPLLPALKLFLSLILSVSETIHAYKTITQSQIDLTTLLNTNIQELKGRRKEGNWKRNRLKSLKEWKKTCLKEVRHCRGKGETGSMHCFQSFSTSVQNAQFTGFVFFLCLLTSEGHLCCHNPLSFGNQGALGTGTILPSTVSLVTLKPVVQTRIGSF